MIHVGDCLQLMPTLQANSFDAIVTDPPYHLTTGKSGGTGMASVNLNSAAGRSRITAGFMGKPWDGGDVAFRPETWAEAMRVAKPGAYLAAFGSPRTFHRLACAIEDAGWEIRDTLMWVYGSGFPKSHNGEWGGTALKPAWEPVMLARKPIGGTVAKNWDKHGTGGLNIDGCRILSEGGALREGESSQHRRYAERGGTNFAFTPGPRGGDPLGRWPANLIHDGSDEVVSLFPKKAGAQGIVRGTEPSQTGGANCYGRFGRVSSINHLDTGNAARFFYCAKASGDDRNDGAENNHPTVKPTDLMRYLVRLVCPPNGMVLDPFCGSGSTGRAAIAEGMCFVGIELSSEYAAIATARINAIQPGLGI